MKFRIVKNTYPKHEYLRHGEPGDIVHWEMERRGYCLIRDADNATIITTAPVNKEGLLQSNGKPPVLKGVIAQVKSRGWCLVIEDVPAGDRNRTQISPAYLL